MADTQQNILINIDLETGQVNTELDNLDSKIKNLGEGAKIETFKSVRTQIREAREEAVRLAIAIEQAEAAGENVDNLNKRYDETTKKAASLNDAVDKTNKSIANSNPDNRLQGLISITQGAVVAVQGLAGAFTILGVDSETANESIARLQGLIALTGAISSIDDVIDAYKDLKRNIDLAAISTKVSNAATAAATVIQRAFTGSVVATGTAFKVLRAAIVATGLGALAIALTFVIGKIIDFVSATDDASAATQRFNDKLKDLSDKRLKDIDNATRVRIAKLKAEGASELAIEQATLDGLKQKRTQYDADIKQKDAEYRATRDNAKKEEYKKELDAYIVSRDNLVAEIEITEFNIKRIKREGTESTNKEQQELRDKNSEKVKADTEKDLNDIEEFTNQKRLEDKRRLQTDLQNEIDTINDAYNKRIALAKAFGKKTTELETLRQREIDAVRKQFITQSIQAEAQVNVTATERRIEFLRGRITNLNDEIKRSLDEGKSTLEIAEQDLRKVFQKFGGTSGSWNLLPKDAFIELQAFVSAYINEYRNLFDFRKKQIELERDVEIAKISKLDFGLATDAENEARRKEIIKSITDIAALEIKALATQFNDIRSRTSAEIEAITALNEFQLKEATRRVDSILENSIQSRNKKIIAERQNLNTELLVLENKREASINETFLRGAQAFNELAEKLNKGVITQKQYEDKVSALQFEGITQRLKILKDSSEAEFLFRKEFIDRVTQLEFKDPFTQLTLGSAKAGQRSFVRSLLGSRGKEEFDAALQQASDFYAASTEQENARYNLEKTRRIAQNEETETLEREHKARLLEINTQYKDSISKLNESTLGFELELYDQVGRALGNLSALIGQNTKEGKIAASAEIALQTATGYISGLRLAQKTAEAAPPGSQPFVFAAFYASQIAAVLAAATKAKQIWATAPGGGGSAPNVSAASASPVNASIFNLPPQAQDVRVTNQASQVVRAYITNEDLRTAQERQQFLNKLSSF